MKLRRRLAWGGIFSLLTACSLYPAPSPAPHLFDFGPPHVRRYHGPALPPLAFAGFEAAAGAGGSGIHYRLLDRHPDELRRYPAAIWLAPPTRLMDARLKTRLAALSRPGTPRYLLRLTLVSWEEDFITSTSAEDRVVVDATLERPLDQDWQLHHVFVLTEGAAPGAPGAVVGFASLDHTLDRAITRWIAQAIRLRTDAGVNTQSH